MFLKNSGKGSKERRKNCKEKYPIINDRPVRNSLVLQFFGVRNERNEKRLPLWMKRFATLYKKNFLFDTADIDKINKDEAIPCLKTLPWVR
uniref:hypothetical protein n=1 Tax=unclassified Croceitalea TaxID=2632280 RepID=UPI0030DC96ED